MTFRIVAAVLLAAGISAAQPAEDSTRTLQQQPDSFVADTIPHDSTFIDTLSDTLSAAERARLKFEQRYKENQQLRQEERLPHFSIFDSVVTYFTSPRQNLRRDVDIAYYRDAGDYFRLNPSYFVINNQVTPMRTTVQPFGLSGNRLDFQLYGHTFRNFEQIPQPDGEADMNALPTALDHDIFLMPGPAGQLFGGTGAVATLVTRPVRPDDYEARSALIADQGGFGYAYVRGRMSKRFINGRTLDASIGYRSADGATLGRSSDQYHYYGDFWFPLRQTTGLHVWGRLYNQAGPLAIRPDLFGPSIQRNNFDRQLQASFTKENASHTYWSEFGYSYLRQGSYLSSPGKYTGRYNKLGHGGFATMNWITGRQMVSVDLSGDYLEYDNQVQTIHRGSASSSFRLLDISEGWRYGLTGGAEWVDGEGVQPRGALMLFRDGRAAFLMMSVGYSRRAPSLHELHMPQHSTTLYGSGSYLDSGNPDLKPEQQMVGSVVLELGSPTTNLAISATGGKILDGIDWKPNVQSSTNLSFRLINGDVTFGTVAVQPRLKIADFLTFIGGASYHYLDYDSFTTKAYSPEYQAFSGLELHVYWPQKLIHLYAYGEIVYTGPYDGYVEKGLGEDPITNAKLSFALKDYRMYFIFQNALSRAYRQRDYFTLPGRYFYFGFEWSFLD